MDAPGSAHTVDGIAPSLTIVAPPQPAPLDSRPEAYARDIFSVVSHPIMQRVYEMHARVSDAIRLSLNRQGFLEHKAILMGPVTDPGIRGSKQVTVDYYGHEYKIMSSAILYKQLLVASRKAAREPGRIYFFADNLRLEPIETARTDRHLAEFIQVDVEVADADHHGAMDVAETLLRDVVSSMEPYAAPLREIWTFFEPEARARGLRPRRELRSPSARFKRYTHAEVVDQLRAHVAAHPGVRAEMRQRFGYEPTEPRRDAEIPWEYEWLLSSLHDEPFFIHDYPKGSRGFYDREYPNRPGVLMDFDLVLPDGYGEAASGAAREYEHRRVVARMKETGEKLEKYRWYLEFLQKHGIPSAGFGIGVERTVRYVCGLPSVYLALPCPKIPGVHSP